MIDFSRFANLHTASYQRNVILREFISQHNKLMNPHRIDGDFVMSDVIFRSESYSENAF